MIRRCVSRRSLIGAGLLSVSGLVLPVRIAAAPRSLAMVDPGLGATDLAFARGALASFDPVILEPCVVAQWRRDLRGRLGRSGGAIAMVRWDKALLLGELAREERLRARQRRIGRSLFVIEMGPPS